MGTAMGGSQAAYAAQGRLAAHAASFSEACSRHAAFDIRSDTARVEMASPTPAYRRSAASRISLDVVMATIYIFAESFFIHIKIRDRMIESSTTARYIHVAAITI
jgi:hypothetical protein